MEELLDFVAYLPVIAVLEVLCVVFSILFMHYSAQHRNQKLSLGWYICGVLFGLWTVIIFLIKRKEFPGPNIKICEQCGDKYPESFQMCSRCLIDLPQINVEEKYKQKKLSKIFGVGLVITYISTLIVGIVMGATAFSDFDDFFDMTDRIAVNGVFYDKKGNSYEDEKSVLLYDEDDRIYTYTEVEITEDDWSYVEYYYVRDDGKKYSAYDCYVTEDGWFYCDMAHTFEMYDPDTENMSEEELDAYYQESIEAAESEYRYYEYNKYMDKDGNIYYNASEASWNEKGELITAENDISIDK